MQSKGFCLGSVGLQEPEAVGGAAKAFDALMAGVDDDVFFEAVEGAVVGEFVAPVEGFGGVGEDFDDQFGKAFVGGGFSISLVAGDEDVGVIEAVAGF